MDLLTSLILLVVLFCFSTIDRWWLCFAAIFGVLLQCGLKVRIFGLFVAIGVAKLLKDVISMKE